LSQKQNQDRKGTESMAVITLAMNSNFTTFPGQYLKQKRLVYEALIVKCLFFMVCFIRLHLKYMANSLIDYSEKKNLDYEQSPD